MFAFFININMRILDFLNFEDETITDNLMEALIPSKDTIVNILKTKDYDIQKSFYEQDWFGFDKNKENKFHKLFKYHLTSLKSEISTFVMENPLVDKRTILSNLSLVKSGLTNHISLSAYITFKTKNGIDGMIRISDHIDRGRGKHRKAKNVFNMWYTSWFSETNKEKITKYIDTLYNYGERLKQDEPTDINS